LRERRRATRHRCRLRCTLRAGRRTDEALVLDVSLSGLLVQTTLVLGQGDDVAIEIEGGVHLKALAWHARVNRRGREESFVVGMMLSEVGPDYEALVARIAGPGAEAGTRAHAAPRAAVPVGAAARPAPARPKRPPPLPVPVRSSSWWRLRIKQVDGPRTRVVTLAAASKEHAIAQSLAELGSGWEILDAVASGAAS
jgi:PilZ domain-containing protein